MALCAATMQPHLDSVYPGDISLAVANALTDPAVHVHHNASGNNAGVTGSYQLLYESSKEEILCFMHDDVIVRERGWDARILQEFADPAVGLVGFGGALWHGTPDLYKVPYQLQNLRRGDYRSNVDDAEIHGSRFTEASDVAVLDGFALIVRWSLLDRIGGWSFIRTGCDFYCYDYALCALARRLGYRIRVVGIRCHHRGGQTSVHGDDAVKQITAPEAYTSSHRWFYETFRDVMPWKVKH